ncbi:MAG: tRNA uridine-5-carboxymethylaminomethyl(34) synthesis GTPase MnmE, partial [Alphaproteobacteria bacterium]|nr:tRNA uridine-5-carboxymethylaminomethyl(34) synthesis GTPase MnmE [Alphaproteobacteria bacterium]
MTQPGATIFAPATGAGRAGIAVIRVSGPGAGLALRALGLARLPPPRRATRARLRDAAGESIDDGLVLWFPAPASYTGEDVAELHVHGGRATVAAMLGALAAIPGLRPAEPGEFTRRAFENGKFDLTAAEGLADLVAAETEAQRRQALRQRDGALARLYDGWRGRLVRTLAHLEADLDFADEDLPDDLGRSAATALAALAAEVHAHLAGAGRGERLRDGLSIAIVGAPNVGKSSLLNVLAQREAAIVATTAGTTRDVIEVHLDLGGYPVVLADTAGLRPTDDPVEGEGVRRARARAMAADLKLAVFDATVGVDDETAGLVDADSVVVMNKVDAAAGPVPGAVAGRSAHQVSARTGAGIADLLAVLTAEAGRRMAVGAQAGLTR